MMKNLIKFEFLKLFKSKKNKVIFTILFICIGGYIALLSSYERAFEGFVVDDLQFTLTSIEEGLVDMQNDENVPEYIIENSLEKKSLYEKLIKSYKAEDWATYLQAQIEIDEAYIRGVQEGTVFGGEGLKTVEPRIQLNKLLLERNLKPNLLEERAFEGYYLLKSIFTIMMGVLGIILSLILLGDILSDEYEKGTIKFLYSQPIKRINVLNAKLIVSLISVTLTFLLIGILIFIFGSIYKGTGYYDYPVIAVNGDIYKLITSIGLSGLLFVFVILFIICLQFLFTLLSGSNILSIGLTVIVTILLNMFTKKIELLEKIAHLLPTTYFDSFSVLDGSLGEVLNNEHVTLFMGVLTLIIFSVGLYIASFILINKKQL